MICFVGFLLLMSYIFVCVCVCVIDLLNAAIAFPCDMALNSGESENMFFFCSGLDLFLSSSKDIHPWKLTWNLKITRLKRKSIFQTSIFGFHVSFRGRSYVVVGLVCVQLLQYQSRTVMGVGTPQKSSFFRVAELIGVHGSLKGTCNPRVYRSFT